MSIPANRKYAADGGPTFRDSFALLRSAVTRPAREVLKLADAAIFNLIIGNADAHAKNHSLLRCENGEVVLAPLYDLVATHMWRELSPKLAIKFGGAANLEEFDWESLARFAHETGLGAPYLRRRVNNLAARVSEEIAKGIQMPGNPPQDVVAPMADILSARASLAALKLLES